MRQNISKLKTTAINSDTLNNLIKLGLEDYKVVVALAETLMILNLNTFLSVETILLFLEREQANINAKIVEEVVSAAG